METIDVRGLPESVAKAIGETVQNLRQQFARRGDGPPKELPVLRLGVIGTLSRKDIYDHLDEG